MTLPTFLGIGAPRSGTTWLHTLLARHPEVYMPDRRKEIRFFERNYRRGIGWYEGFFSAADGVQYRAIGEISPLYLYHPEVPERIADLLPDVRLLVILRHPIDRAYSNYGFQVQRRNFKGTFDDYLDRRPSALEKGFYSRYLDRYLGVFERDRLLALIFEDMFADLDDTQARLARHLSITVERFPPAKAREKVNASTVPKLGAASNLATTTGRRLRRWGLDPVVDFARRIGIQRLLTEGAEMPKLDPDHRARLSEQFMDEFGHLESLLGIDLDRWRA